MPEGRLLVIALDEEVAIPGPAARSSDDGASNRDGQADGKRRIVGDGEIRDRSAAQRGDYLVRCTTTASVTLLAVIAAVVSYGHMHALVLAHGEGPWASALIPLSVDGMIVASSMSLLLNSRLGGRGGVLPWVLPDSGSAGQPGREYRGGGTDGDRPGHRGMAKLCLDGLV
jgi:hypothetical protein